jgi:hypothetical protein
MPPAAAIDVAVAALVLLPDELVFADELLLHPAANISPVTAMAAAATVLLLGT